MKTLEHMLKKSGLKMNAENALKLIGKVKYVVVTTIIQKGGGRLNGEVVHPFTSTKANYGCAWGIEYIKY